jgi:pimeloyl-ACP methyl ester carboxylesterase
MPALLVHGVPDTERVWRAVLPRLARADVVTLRLPGFGGPVPAGFDATKDAYAAWLVEQILAHDGPVDLVGHDWGALLVIRAACLRPDHVRTWTAGGAPLDAEYVWHKAAQAWQTPEVGERVMAQLTPTALGGALVTAGVPPDDAREAAAHVDDTMKRCILRLYRSAIKVGEEWGPDLGKLSAPGLILWGERDSYAAPMWGERLAARTKARFVALPGCSHWWQLERPADVAVLLTKHWETAGR